MTKKLLEESTVNRWKELAGINEAKKEWDEFDTGTYSEYVNFKHDGGISIIVKRDRKFPTSFTTGYALIAWPGQAYVKTKLKAITTSAHSLDKEGLPSLQKNKEGEPEFYLKNADQIFSSRGKYIGELPPKEQKSKEEREKLAKKLFNKQASKDFLSPGAINPKEINQ